MSKKDPAFTAAELAKMLAAGLNEAIHQPKSMITYSPHEKQLEFHQNADKFGRMFIGGNRSGKTVSGAMEAIWWITRQHPYIKIPEWKIEGRVGTVDFEHGMEKITKPEVRDWLAPSFLINGSWEDSWNNANRTLTLANGNYLEFLSYSQDTDKWAGTARDFIWFDEEPPKNLFEEGVVRLTSKMGKYWLTMTPVERITWTYSDLFEPAREGRNPNLHIVEVNTEENTHINQAHFDMIMDLMGEEEKEIRKAGKYIHNTGLIFGMFEPSKHVLDKLPFSLKHPDVRIYSSVDLAINSPTAWLWHAVLPNGSVYTFHEIYKRDHTIPQLSRMVHEFERTNGIKVAARFGDPAAKQRAQQTGMSNHLAYAKEGLAFSMPTNTYDTLDKMRDYLLNDKWFVTINCVNTIKEFRKYRWEEWDTRKLKEKNEAKPKPHKKDDHAMDSSRYFFTSRPELKLPKDESERIRIAELNKKVRAITGGSQQWDNLDPTFFVGQQGPDEYTHITEVGGEW